MTKHTPGPWNYNPEIGIIEKTQGLTCGSIGYTSEPIAVVEPAQTHNGQANIKLMTAAPEMLGLLKLAVVYLENPEVQTIPFALNPENLAKSIRELIKKTEACDAK